MASDQASSNNGASDVPEPIVKIDNESDPFATIVTVEYGDRLGELLDTVSLISIVLCLTYSFRYIVDWYECGLN